MKKLPRLSRRPGLRVVGLFFSFLALVVLGALFVIQLPFILPGVRLGHLNIGGLTLKQAEVQLSRTTESRPKTIFFESATDRVAVETELLPLQIDWSASLALAYKVGRDPNIFVALKDQLTTIFKGIDLALLTPYSPTDLGNFIVSYLNKFENLVIEATLTRQADHFEVQPARTGQLVDKTALALVIGQVLNNQDSTVVVPLITAAPTITTEQAKAAKARADEILIKTPFQVRVGGKSTWKITRATLINWLTFDNNHQLALGLDKATINDFITSLAPSVSTSPQNAILATKNGSLAVLEPDLDGQMLDITNTVANLSYALLAPQVSSVEATIIRQPAQVRADNLDELGLLDLLAVGETDFVGSSNSRAHNVSVGGARFNGVIIKPEEIFSFNERLGEVGPEQGYEPELVIKGDRTIPEYGGGLCQVSTTLFRAAVNAGLNITERRSHSYVVRYYNPIGFDATIYPPYTDLKIKNTTPGHLYVQSEVKGTKITFKVFGTSDGRSVKLIGPTTSEKQPDGSMKATLTQEIYDQAGALTAKKTFYSNYKSPALFPVIRNPLE